MKSLDHKDLWAPAHPEPRGWKSSKHRFWNIFVSGMGKRRSFSEAMEFIFWRTLCPIPDQTRFGMWWYGKSARIAGYFHAKHCKQCQRKAAPNTQTTAPTQEAKP